MLRGIFIAVGMLAGGITLGLASTGTETAYDAVTQSSPIPRFTPPARGCGIIHYVAGWNLIGGNASSMIRGNSGPLYTLQAGDTGYQALSSEGPLATGVGYWAYFPQPTDVLGPLGDLQPLTIAAPVGQFIMVGNPYPTAAIVSGADAAYIYDTAAGSYRASTTVDSGYGAWVYSAQGISITLAPPFPRQYTDHQEPTAETLTVAPMLIDVLYSSVRPRHGE